MKGRGLIGLLLMTVFLVSCHTPTREAKRMIARAEQLADTLPDSTVRLIDSVLRMSVYFNERQRMDMALLQAEALFGRRDVLGNVSASTISPIMDDDFFENAGFISTSPDLERAAAYYAKKKQYTKAAHAALYCGFVQQHHNEKEAAMLSFKEAEQYGGIVHDSITVALAQYRMGEMLMNDGMEQEALDMLQVAELSFGNLFVEKALVQNMMGVCYMLQDVFDKSETCLKNSLDYATKATSFMVKRKVLNNYAVLYRLQGKYNYAIECLRQIPDGADLSDTEKSLFYLNLGNTFVANEEIDSAVFYYQKLEEILPYVVLKNETKVSVYGALSRFAKDQGNDSLALQFRENHEIALYDVMIQRQEQDVFRIQKQYDYESLQNEMNRKIIHRHQIILVISILLVISFAVIMVLQYRQKRILEAEEEMKQQIDAMKQDLRKTIKTSTLDCEVASRLRMILTAKDVSKRAKDSKNEWKSLVRQVMNGRDSLFEAARISIEIAYPDLYQTIKERHLGLTETETKVCLLSFTDLSNAEMAELLELSTNTVNQTRSTLRKKLNIESQKMSNQLRDTFSR